jgi:hypothetical protein
MYATIVKIVKIDRQTDKVDTKPRGDNLEP